MCMSLQSLSDSILSILSAIFSAHVFSSLDFFIEEFFLKLWLRIFIQQFYADTFPFLESAVGKIVMRTYLRTILYSMLAIIFLF